MTTFIAISDQDRGQPFQMFTGETEDACFEKLAAFLGETVAPDATIEDRSNGRTKLHLRDIDPRGFWFTWAAAEFSRNDNRDWFFGTDQEEVEARARAFHGGVIADD